MSVSTELLRDSVATSASIARVWFEGRTTLKTKQEFDGRGQLRDKGTGAVYVFFSKDGKGVYVGQTGRKVKARLHDQTSPHKNARWWKSWSSMRFLQLPDEIDRLTLEFLLILAYQPTANAKPRAKPIVELFPLKQDAASDGAQKAVARRSA